MIDIATDDPHLPALIDMLTQYELKLVKLYIDAGVDVIGFHTDIGTQRALMISPEKFRKYIKPMFKTIFQTVRDAGVLVVLSSDGRLVDIVDDLVECGVNMHDPQFRANTLDGIERAYKGKMCINLDLDRQMFAFCTPRDIHEQVRQSVERLNSPQGGLMLTGSVWDSNTPLENIEALIAAMEEHCLKGKTQSPPA
jgi:uroporphyrinogen decarboxylase